MTGYTRKKFKGKVLIADDSELNRSLLADMLGDDFEVVEACDGRETVNCMRSELEELSLVLLDLVMPRMDGFAVLDIMNKFKWIEEVPVIVISAENDASMVEKAYELGATDFITRPFDVATVRRRALNTVMLYSKQKKLSELIEEQVYEREKEQTLMIGILSHLVEFRDGENGQQVLEINTITELLLMTLMKRSDKYRLTQKDVSLIVTASLLHDIGKIAIDDKILNKHGKLTADEYEIIKTHAMCGAELIEKMPYFDTEPLLHVAYEICRWHHERFDGKGYPDGLKGEAIPIAAQVVGLADVYVTLTSDRVYQKAFSHAEAVKMILCGQCGAFDPVLLNAFAAVSDTIPKIIRRGQILGSGRANAWRKTEKAENYDLTVSHRSLSRLERERSKYRFLVSVSDDILFELYADPAAVWFSDKSANALGLEPYVPDPANNEAIVALMGEENLERLTALISAASKDVPLVDFEFTSARGKRCRIRLLVQFEFDSERFVYKGAVGKAELVE